jgi:hypothetical protein
MYGEFIMNKKKDLFDNHHEDKLKNNNKNWQAKSKRDRTNLRIYLVLV